MTNQLLDMNETAFLAAASAANDGLTDFGDESFREPLRVLIDAINTEAQLIPEGLFGWQQRTLQLLSHRLRMQELIRQHPEILDEPIARPLFIVSLQRTGTTKLQKVLACDERWNTPVLWEAMFPVPFPGETPGDPTPRIEAAKAWTDMLYQIAPQIRAAHPMFAEEVEEETYAVELSFRWTVAAISAKIPRYIDWVETHTAVPTYADLKRTLQVLQWQRGKRRPWLLKAPWHLGFLTALVEVFPDATVVQCHRDPYDSVPSNCALMYLGRSMGRPSLSKLEHGTDVLAMNGRQMATHFAQRDALGKNDPTIDVHYKEIVSDAVGVVKKIYAARGETLSSTAEQRIRNWEHDNAQHKFGKFEYSAEEYGITRENVAAAFAEYYQRAALFR